MSFEQLFGTAPAVVISTPGRVNLIGEHTDYNDGFVLPTVLTQTTMVELAPRGGHRVRVASRNAPEATPQTYMLGQEKNQGGWSTYIQGVTHILAASGMVVTGFDAWIHSQVPTGAGLSSSAALTVGLIKALRLAFNLDLTDTAVALLARRVENEFVGAHVGVMDQMAVSLAAPGQALFLDTRSLEYQLVPLPPAAAFLVINSGVSHSNIGGGYSDRRAACEESAKRLRIPALRDLTLADLGKLMALPPVLMRRSRHVVTENARVIAAVEAMRSGDLSALGMLFKASHASMRDDFEITIPEIDVLVEIACADPAVYGARMTGGGFGGSIVALANFGEAKSAAQRIAERYAARTGKQPTVIMPS